jgi:hypothetical protein
MRVVKHVQGISLPIEAKTFLVDQLLGTLISPVKICVFVTDPDWKCIQLGLRIRIRNPDMELPETFEGGGRSVFPGCYKEMSSILSGQ